MQRHFGEDELQCSGSASGTHLFLRLPRLAASQLEPFLRHAEAQGVRLYGSRAYYLRAPRGASLICGYATLSPERIAVGVERLERAWRGFGRR